ncbi:MAG: hypothetical protein JKY93_07315 [Gammaproteobacteria bacterium]|nr:hypothetical protein [Gammaproteobacteria bacterium]
MNKKLIAIAVAAGLAIPAAANADVSGFVDVIYEISDDETLAPNTKSATEGKFTADAEVDFVGTVDGVTVRLDVDFKLGTTASGEESAHIEQAFFAAPIGGVTLIGGVFNNPIGHDAEDAPDIDFTSHSIAWDVLNLATELDGNNVAGLAVAGQVGPVTLTGAFVNEVQQANEENSTAIVANFSPAEGVALELGILNFEETNGLGIGDSLTNINGTWAIDEMFTIGGEIVSYDKGFDSSTSFWAAADLGDFVIKARIEEMDAETGNAEVERTTFYVGTSLAKNVSVALEVHDIDVTAGGLSGVNSVDGGQTTIEFIGTF